MTGDDADSAQEGRMRAELAADALIGVCGTTRLEDVLDEEDQGDVELLRYFDTLAFECSECGWWCGAEEETEAGMCQNCAPEEDGDDTDD